MAPPSTPKSCLGEIWGFPPSLELEKEAALQKAVVEMIGAGLLESAKDCSEGGLAVTLAECGFARGIGSQVQLSSNGLVPEFVLFGEDASRVLISCDPQNVQRIQQVAGKFGLSVEPIGDTGPDQLEIQIDGKVAVKASVSELREAWGSALERALQVETEERLVPSTLQKS